MSDLGDNAWIPTDDECSNDPTAFLSALLEDADKVALGSPELFDDVDDLENTDFLRLLQTLEGLRVLHRYLKVGGRLPDQWAHVSLGPDYMYSRVHIPSQAWHRAGEPNEPGGEDAILIGTLQVSGLMMHVTAFQVEDDEDGNQYALQRDEQVAELHAAYGADGKWQATTLFNDDRDYVLFAEPYS